ncbi:MAG: hypothetical protein EA357_03120 [Micavibrio sp.]|nr:MAG: hypothetical protein EA357_03120 [Micavibrio sp.]
MPFTKTLANFFTALFVGLLGLLVCAATMMLSNSASNAFEIVYKLFLMPVIASGFVFYTATYIVISLTDGTQKFRSVRVNKIHTTFWSVMFVVALGLTGKGMYDYFTSEYFIGSEMHLSRGQLPNQQEVCDPRFCLRYDRSSSQR